jgi:glycosyltransferase involved in cell wall biosynthesis
VSTTTAATPGPTVGDADGARPRALVVTRDETWPIDSGRKNRQHHLIEQLARFVDVDLFVLRQGGAPEPTAPPYPVARLGSGVYEFRKRTARTVATDPRVALAPNAVQMYDDRSTRAAARAFAVGVYAFVLYFNLETFWGLHRALAEWPAVLDLDILQDLVKRQAIDLTPSRGMERVSRTIRGRAVATLWKGYQDAAARTADLVLTCSPVDLAALGAGSVLVANGMNVPATLPARDLSGDERPRLVFQANFEWEPNARAGEELVQKIAPIVRQELPGTQARLVGIDKDIDHLHDPPRSVVTGPLPSLVPEVMAADAVVVPLRRGSGTKIKVLEAMAAGTPVVGTAIAAEGLEVEDGVHYLHGETPAELAAACVRLVREPELAERIRTNAFELMQREYSWDGIGERFATQLQAAGLLGAVTLSPRAGASA